MGRLRSFALALTLAAAALGKPETPACPEGLGALVALGPPPAALEYDALLDAPIDWEKDAKDPDHRERLRRAFERYRNPPEGVGSMDHGGYVAVMASHWFRRAAGYVASRDDWSFEEKVEALREFGARVMRRAQVPVVGRVWSMEVHGAKDGSVVFTGPDHRLVVLNRPGAPLVKGFIPDAERRRIARSGSVRNYYSRWEPDDLDVLGLAPVKPLSLP